MFITGLISVFIVIATIIWIKNRLYLLRVSGSSMHPFYKDGELLLILKAKKYQVGDAVVASVNIKGFTEPVTVLKRISSIENRNMYRLIGDNSQASLDSRSPAFGMVPEKKLRGKVIFKLDSD